VTETSILRRIAGILRLAAAATLAVALGFQIIEKTVNDDMVPEEYFSYFTILTTIIAIAVTAVGGVMALRLPTDTVRYTVARMSVLTYAVVTAVVYNLLLRGIPDEGFVVSAWPGELMHVWIPLVLLLDWLLSPGRPALRWSALCVAVIYPLAWVAFTLVRGGASGWYPYPFLEPSTGVVSVAGYILGIAAFIIGLAALAVVHSRLRGAGAPR